MRLLKLSETLQRVFISCHSEQENLSTWRLNAIHAVQDYFKEAISANYPTNVAVEDNPRPRYLDPAIAKEIQKLEVDSILPQAASSFLQQNPAAIGVLKRQPELVKWIEVALAGPPGLPELHTLFHELCHFLTAVAKGPHPNSTVLGVHLQKMARTARLPQKDIDPLLEYANEVLSRKISFSLVQFPRETLEEWLEGYSGYSVLVQTARKLNESLGLTDDDFVRALLFWEGRRDLETKLGKKNLTLEQYAIKLAEQYETGRLGAQ